MPEFLACFDCGLIAPLHEIPVSRVTDDGRVLCPACGCGMHVEFVRRQVDPAEKFHREVTIKRARELDALIMGEADVPMPEAFRAFVEGLDMTGFPDVA